MIGGNIIIVGNAAKDLIAEFNTTKMLRLDVAKPVRHNSLRLPNTFSFQKGRYHQIPTFWLHLASCGFTKRDQWINTQCWNFLLPPSKRYWSRQYFEPLGLISRCIPYPSVSLKGLSEGLVVLTLISVKAISWYLQCWYQNQSNREYYQLYHHQLVYVQGIE